MEEVQAAYVPTRLRVDAQVKASQPKQVLALNWMGHKHSDILDMYVTIFDEAADSAMQTINYSRPTTSAPTTDGRSQISMNGIIGVVGGPRSRGGDKHSSRL